MEIKEVTAYAVDNHIYHTREEAEKFVDYHKNNDKIVSENLAKLKGRTGLIPAQIGSLSYPTLFYLSDDGNWKNVINDAYIEYLRLEIELLTPGQFMAKFEKSQYRIDAPYFQRWVNGVAEMNLLAGEVLTLKEFAAKIGETEISPF